MGTFSLRPKEGGRPLFGGRLLRSLLVPAPRRGRRERNSVGLYVFLSSGLTIGVLAAIAMVSGQPFVFPSLGPTAFLLFAEPMEKTAAPHATVLGHLIGALAGYVALVVFGLTQTAPNLQEVTPARVGAVALALALTLGLMEWLDVPHAPAGATTMIVAMGLLRTPMQLAVLMLAVIVLASMGFVVNRLAGLPYPVWRPALDEGPAPVASGRPQERSGRRAA